LTIYKSVGVLLQNLFFNVNLYLDQKIVYFMFKVSLKITANSLIYVKSYPSSNIYCLKLSSLM